MLLSGQLISLTGIILVAPLLGFAQAVGISIPLSAPTGASRIYGDHVSFSLEQDRWLDWVGRTSRNDFFFNSLENIRKITGLPPRIRVGANSEDRTHFNPALDFVQLVFPTPSYNVPYPEATNIVVGDEYYRATRFLPRDTLVTWGLNLGSNNLTASYLLAQSIAKTFKTPEVVDANIKLEAIELGNEPDLFGENGHRAPGYSVAQYVPEWTAMATNVTGVLGMSSTSFTKFLASSMVWTTRSTTGWSPQALFAQGLLDSPAGRLISTISQHRYSGSFCEGSPALLQDLVTKTTIRGNISFHAPDIVVTRSKGLDYVLGETNSFACHGAPGVSNVAGAALWTLDYFLYAAAAGISRIFFHEGIGFKYNFIQPVTLDRSPVNAQPLPAPLPPHVQPQYYAHIIAAEATGASNNARIVDLPVNDARIAAYGLYEGDVLVRAVFIESSGYYKQASAPGTRRSTQVNLTFEGTGTRPTTMTIKRLAVPYSDVESGLRWGGVSYETSTALPEGALQVETGNVSQGFKIQATEVVMVSFQR